jgi:hypothetical protein
MMPGWAPEIRRGAQQLTEGLTHGGKQQRGHERDLVQPHGVEVVRDRKDHVVMIAVEEAGFVFG